MQFNANNIFRVEISFIGLNFNSFITVVTPESRNTEMCCWTCRYAEVVCAFIADRKHTWHFHFWRLFCDCETGWIWHACSSVAASDDEKFAWCRKLSSLLSFECCWFLFPNNGDAANGRKLLTDVESGQRIKLTEIYTKRRGKGKLESEL